LNPDLPRANMGPVRDALASGRIQVVEVTNMRADGTRFTVEGHSANCEYEAQPCVVAVARDLSGRAEAELRYRELMAVVDKGILVRDASGTVVCANAAAMRMLDVDPTLGVAESLRPSRWKVIDEDGKELSEQDM